MAALTRPYVASSPKSPWTYEKRFASRSNTASSSCSPVPTIESRARWISWSTDQSSTATPTIGQSRRPRRSSRYSERKVITFARSPVMPKMTSTSALLDPSATEATLTRPMQRPIIHIG